MPVRSGNLCRSLAYHRGVVIVIADRADFVDHCPCVWREALANRFDVANHVQETVRLRKKSILLDFRALARRWRSIKMVRDVIERDAGLMIPVVQKVFKEARVSTRVGQ